MTTHFILLLPSVFIATPSPYSEPLIFPFPLQITCTLLFPFILLQPSFQLKPFLSLKEVPHSNFHGQIPGALLFSSLLLPNPPVLAVIPLYFAGSCSYHKPCIHIWRFAARSLQWERTRDICLSGSELPHSIRSFLLSCLPTKFKVSFFFLLIYCF